MNLVIVTATGKMFGPYNDGEYSSPDITEALDNLPASELPATVNVLRDTYDIPKATN